MDYNVGSNGGVWFPPPRYQDFMNDEVFMPLTPPPQYQDFLYEEATIALLPLVPPQYHQDVASTGDLPSYLESVPLEMQLEIVSNILTDIFGADSLGIFSGGPVILFGNLTDELRASLCVTLDPSHLGMVMVQEFLDE